MKQTSDDIQVARPHAVSIMKTLSDSTYRPDVNLNVKLRLHAGSIGNLTTTDLCIHLLLEAGYVRFHRVVSIASGVERFEVTLKCRPKSLTFVSAFFT